MRRLAVVCALLALAGAMATTAMAAAPRLILVDQGGLPRPIVLADWPENSSFSWEWLRARPVPRKSLSSRPSYRLSFMWGPIWNDYVEEGEPLGAIRPSDTDHHGRFWPSWRGRAAAVDLGRGVLVEARRATPTQLRILLRAGVPIRVGG